MVKVKFKLLLLKFPNWWIKVTIITTIIPLIIILMHSVAANAVSNPLYTVNAANAVYKEEQWLKLNIAFTIAP